MGETCKEKRSNKRVLIVDDSDLAIQLLQAALSNKGMEILIATNAEEATRLLIKPDSRPDLVLLDVRMPGIDGKQFCRFIKNNEMFRGIKILFCSGMDVEELAELTKTCNADGYVHKDEYLGKWVSEQCG